MWPRCAISRKKMLGKNIVTCAVGGICSSITRFILLRVHFEMTAAVMFCIAVIAMSTQLRVWRMRWTETESREVSCVEPVFSTISCLRLCRSLNFLSFFSFLFFMFVICANVRVVSGVDAANRSRLSPFCRENNLDHVRVLCRLSSWTENKFTVRY